MSYYRSPGPNPVFSAAFLFIGLLIVYSIYWNHEQAAACSARGGVYFCPYKSSCLCLAKGVVLP